MGFELTPRLKLAAAVTRVCDARNGWMPYFSAALMGLIRVESPEIPTLAVSKFGVLYWSPAWVAANTVEIIAAGLMHETMHVLLKHHERAEALGIVAEPGAPIGEEMARKAKLANWAEDASINEQLRAVQVTLAAGNVGDLPMDPGWIYPETLNQPAGLVFEERYRRLLENPPPPPQGGGGGGGKGGKGKPGGQPPQDGPEGVGKGACGSCTGRPTHGEPRGQQGEGIGRSEAEMERIRRQVAADVKAHAQASKSRGTVPADLLRWADELLAPPKVDWRTHLAQAIRAAVAYRQGSVAITWLKPSRRQAGVGYGPGRPIMPAMHAPVPRVAVIVDTSGSMGSGDDSPLAQAVTEIQGVLRDVGAAVTIIACDSAAGTPKECATMAEACGALVGGGGTDMTPAFRTLGKRQPPPEVVICLTDGWIGGGHPSTEPDWCRTVWCLVGGNTEKPCPWGETIIVEPEGARAAA